MENHDQQFFHNLDLLEGRFKLWIREVLAEHPQVNAENQDIISIEEAMKITHLARQTIYGLVFEKKIPFFKRPHSKKLFFSRTVLLNWMQPHSNENHLQSNNENKK